MFGALATLFEGYVRVALSLFHFAQIGINFFFEFQLVRLDLHDFNQMLVITLGHCLHRLKLVLEPLERVLVDLREALPINLRQ